MSKPLAVIDSSCLISFYLGRKGVAHIAVQALRKTHDLLASNETLEELRKVIMRKKFDRISSQSRLSSLDEYQQLITLIEPKTQVTICVDPKDNMFLSVAVSGKASLLLSDDDHLVRLHPFNGIDILKPVTYLERAGLSAPR